MSISAEELARLKELCAKHVGVHDDGSAYIEGPYSPTVFKLVVAMPALIEALEASQEQHVEKDGPCHYCGEETDSWAGNPSRWPLRFPHKDGITEAHHVGCVLAQLRENERLRTAKSKHFEAMAEKDHQIQALKEQLEEATTYREATPKARYQVYKNAREENERLRAQLATAEEILASLRCPHCILEGTP